MDHTLNLRCIIRLQHELELSYMSPTYVLAKVNLTKQKEFLEKPFQNNKDHEAQCPIRIAAKSQFRRDLGEDNLFELGLLLH